MAGNTRVNDGRLSATMLRNLLISSRTIAVVGASANPLRPSYGVMRYLIDAGYTVLPGHGGQAILGQTVYAALADIPVLVDIVDIFRRHDALSGVVDEALALSPRPKAIWMQLGLSYAASAARAEAAGLQVVMDRCIKVDHAALV